MPDNPPPPLPRLPHYFHAEALSLKGKLEFPIDSEIRPQAFVKIAGTLKGLLGEEGKRNYFSQHAKDYRLEGVFSYTAAQTQVSGHKSTKHDDASVTLATSAVENLNILNVVTADRVVAQISTTHFPGKYVPEVTFLGTHFENLRIARHKVEPILDLQLVGKPVDDKLYVSEDSKLVKAVRKRYDKMPAWLKRFEGAEYRRPDKAKLPPEDERGSLTKKYHWGRPDYDDILKRVAAARKMDEDRMRVAAARKMDEDRMDVAAARKVDEDRTTTEIPISEGLTFSLVEDIVIEPIKEDNDTALRDAKELVEGRFGHVIHVPDFGTIFLAELTVNHNSFELAMIRVEMGCIAAGHGTVAYMSVNGGGSSGH